MKAKQASWYQIAREGCFFETKYWPARRGPKISQLLSTNIMGVLKQTLSPGWKGYLEDIQFTRLSKPASTWVITKAVHFWAHLSWLLRSFSVLWVYLPFSPLPLFTCWLDQRETSDQVQSIILVCHSRILSLEIWACREENNLASTDKH